MLRHILLATDGSPGAERAADFAASLAIRYHARITVLHAFAAASGPPAWSRAAAQAALAALAERLAGLGVAEITPDLAEGPAPNVILGAADNVRPDLIVMGARGNGTWSGLTLGSVSMAVTQRAECPVLIVR